MKSDKNITMKEAKRRTGLSSRQIRYYDEQDLIFPERSSGNQRLFSESDIKVLEKIKELLAQGNSIETIRSKITAPEIEEDLSEDDYQALDYDDSFNKYGDADLDSLYPVSNRSALLKKLSLINKTKSPEGESKDGKKD
ncbi:MAG: MerR family transcriptional regulator [Halanaerobium sp. MSAO_Bac5]|nr:MAG: MerR family transcriptional regulator [Halanaerobium sp. MSAO_Bac5]